MKIRLTLALLALLAVAASVPLLAGEFLHQKSPGYDDTPMLPDGKWRVHDSKRPHPKVITPGTFSTAEQPGKPPSDATVLFDGTDLSKWKGGKWKVENGTMEVVKSGNLTTVDEFGDCQLHIEWASPDPGKGESQGRGNSGVFLMGQFEVQVLDSYENLTYADGQAAAMYGQNPPLVNACRKPGEWQVYDILFTTPKYKDGKLESPAYLTVIHNGVVVHNHTAYLGPSQHRQVAKYGNSGPTKGPISLQDHGNPVRFRNIWIRPIKGYEEP
jgi:hypothetical protein